jgi:hypothetical protein
MVKPFESNAHGARPLPEANQTDTFGDAIARFGYDRESNKNQRRRLDGFSVGNAFAAGDD